MKKCILLLTSAVYIFSFLVSCKKNNSVPAGNRVKTFMVDRSPASNNRIDTFDISYDANNRVTGRLSRSGEQHTYTYNSNSVVHDINDNGLLVVREFSYLNNQLLVDSIFKYSNTGDSSTEKLIYNGDNQLAQKRQYRYSSLTGAHLSGITDYAYDNMGNVNTETYSDDMGIIRSTQTYTHTTILDNNIPFQFPYYPVTHKYLTTTQTIGSVVINYEYRFDNLNRLIEQKSTTNTGGFILLKLSYE